MKPPPAPPPVTFSVEDAQQVLNTRVRLIADCEDVKLEQALGRITAQSVIAMIDVPGYDNSAMDGYAIHTRDQRPGGTTRLRVTQRITAGCSPISPLGPGEAARIFTGAIMPDGADAVAIQENCVRDGDDVVVLEPTQPGAFIRPRGNNITSGQQVLKAGVRIRPQEIGILAAIGHLKVRCRKPARVAILSSGDELLSPGQPLKEGMIYNSNRYGLLGMLTAMQCEIVDLGIVGDDLDTTCELLRSAANQADLIVTTGGVSVGEEDHLVAALAICGRVEMYTIRVKPGKPLLYGRIGDADMFGLPGNPVSTLVAFMLFVRPFLLRRLGAFDVDRVCFTLPARFTWSTPVTRREFARARLEITAGAATGVHLFPQQGSDVLRSMVWADGLVEITEGRIIAEGDPVPYFPFSSLL